MVNWNSNVNKKNEYDKNVYNLGYSTLIISKFVLNAYFCPKGNNI